MNSRGLAVEKSLDVAYISVTLVVPLMVVSGVFAMNGTTAGILSCLACIALTSICQTVLYQLAIRYFAYLFSRTSHSLATTD